MVPKTLPEYLILWKFPEYEESKSYPLQPLHITLTKVVGADSFDIGLATLFYSEEGCTIHERGTSEEDLPRGYASEVLELPYVVEHYLSRGDVVNLERLWEDIHASGIRSQETVPMDALTDHPHLMGMSCIRFVDTRGVDVFDTMLAIVNRVHRCVPLRSEK